MILHSSRNRLLRYVLLTFFITLIVIFSQLLIFASVASSIQPTVLEDSIFIDSVGRITLTGDETGVLATIPGPLISSGQALPVESLKATCNEKDNQKKLAINLYKRKIIDLPEGASRQELIKIFKIVIDIPPRPACKLEANVFVTITKYKWLTIKVVIPEINLTKEYEPFLVK
jgi:hypothetical protein